MIDTFSLSEVSHHTGGLALGFSHVGTTVTSAGTDVVAELAARVTVSRTRCLVLELCREQEAVAARQQRE